MTRLDIDDVIFAHSVTNIHAADGSDDRVQRFRQADGKRFLAWEEGGWVYFRAKRLIMVPRTGIVNMVPMTTERAKQLGANPYEAVKK
jgi:hypothetical protein